MRELSLDPTTLSPDDDSFTELNEALLQLLSKNTNFIPDNKYIIKLAEEDIIVKLKYSLLKRPRSTKENQTRVEILASEPCAKGGFSSVHKSLGVLIPEDHYKFKEKPLDKTRACKIIPFSKHFDETKINIESSYTKMNDLLYCKDPVFNEYAGFIVMRYIRGREMFELLNDVDNNIIKLTILERFKLTYAILKAYKEQIYDKGLVHRDIKPENIIIHLETMTVTFIDFAFAQPITGEEIPCDIRGSIDFIAPETLMRNVVSPKTDMFSLGLTVAQIWNDYSSFFLTAMDPPATYEEIEQYAHDRRWVDLFKDLELSARMKFEIETLFDCLIAFDPAERMDIDPVLVKWEQIIKDYEYETDLREEIDSVFHSNFSLKKCASEANLPSAYRDDTHLLHHTRISV